MCIYITIFFLNLLVNIVTHKKYNSLVFICQGKEQIYKL